MSTTIQPESTANSPSLKSTIEPRRPLPEGVLAANWSQVAPKPREALDTAIREGAWPIFLFGPVGTGKSCAMACVFQKWRGPTVFWFQLSDIVSQVQRCRSGSGFLVVSRPQGHVVERWESAIWRDISSPGLVCFDDIGLRSPTDPQFEIAYRISNERIGKPTIFTSNLSVNQLAKVYDGRFASRIASGTIIEVTGADRRLTRRIIRV